jgi:Ca-activated chloride channel family protein
MTDGIKSGREESAVVGLFEDNDYELLVMGIGTEAGAPIRVNDGGYLTDNSGQRVVAKLDREPLMSVVERTGGKYHDIQLADS